MSTIAFVVAVGENGVIGRDGRLPWRMPSDLKTFRRLTMGKPIVMGRKTWDSIGKPLDGRDNIVITRDTTFAADGVEVTHSLDAALALARLRAKTRGTDEIMIIGGAEIFRAAMPLAGRIYWTCIHASPDGDAHLDTPSPAEWKEVRREPIPRDPRDDHAATLIVYERPRLGTV